MTTIVTVKTAPTSLVCAFRSSQKRCILSASCILGTGACPTGHFYCNNKGHIGVYIRASRVNDGLCEAECCDGSDELPGICPDVCHVVGEEYRRATEAERKLRKTGSKIRSTYIAFAQKEKVRLEQSIGSLLAEIEVKRGEEAKARGAVNCFLCSGI